MQPRLREAVLRAQVEQNTTPPPCLGAPQLPCASSRRDPRERASSPPGSACQGTASRALEPESNLPPYDFAPGVMGLRGAFRAARGILPHALGRASMPQALKISTK